MEETIRILVVDDEPDIRRICRILLENSGYTVLEAATGLEAVETIRRCRPKLLLAAYHRSEDLFALPQLVFSIRSDYQLYLRHHRQLPAWDVNFYFV